MDRIGRKQSTGLRSLQMGGPNERSVHVLRTWGGCSGRATLVPPRSVPIARPTARPPGDGNHEGGHWQSSDWEPPTPCRNLGCVKFQNNLVAPSYPPPAISRSKTKHCCVSNDEKHPLGRPSSGHKPPCTNVLTGRISASGRARNEQRTGKKSSSPRGRARRTKENKMYSVQGFSKSVSPLHSRIKLECRTLAPPYPDKKNEQRTRKAVQSTYYT
jgi:hypothetical protein